MEVESLNTLPVGEVIILGSTYMSTKGLFSGPKRKKSTGKKWASLKSVIKVVV